MPAPVLQMAVLAGARIEQRPEPVGGIGRSRRRDPVLAEDGVADLEVELALEVHVAGGGGEGVGVGHARLARWRRRRACPRPPRVLEKSVAGAVQAGGRSHRRPRHSSAQAPKKQRQARAKRDQRGKRALYAVRLASAMLRTMLRTTRQRDLERCECNRPSSEPASSKTDGERAPNTAAFSTAPAIFVRHIAAGLPDVLEVRLQRPARG